MRKNEGKNDVLTYYLIRKHVIIAKRSRFCAEDAVSGENPLCFFCEDRTIEIFLRFRCLDLNTLDTIILHHSVSVFKVFYSVISISVPPIKTTLIFSFDSTTTHSMICRTSLSSYSIG